MLVNQAVTTEHERYTNRSLETRPVNPGIARNALHSLKYEMDKKFLPDGLTKVKDLSFLNEAERRFFTQVQGRTYLNMVALVSRLNRIALDGANGTDAGDSQELFQRLDQLATVEMPEGYTFVADTDALAGAMHGKSQWSNQALILLVELFSKEHYRESAAADLSLSGLWKEVLQSHWREEARHALLDESAWQQEDSTLNASERDLAVNELIELLGTMDAILQAQAQADANYFMHKSEHRFTRLQADQIQNTFLKAYRWQYIVSGVQVHRYTDVLGRMITATQSERIFSALSPLINHTFA